MGLTSTKKNIFHTNTASRALRGKDTLGIAVTTGSCPGAVFQPGNGYEYYIFRNNGSFEVLREGVADICVIAGGGGGGAGKASGGYWGGGGGAGGMINIYNRNFVVGTYTVTIGVGGQGSPTGANGGSTTNRNGDNSTVTGPPAFSPIIAIGGGKGGNGDSPTSPYPTDSNYGQPGGSGGGAQTRPGNSAAGLGTSGQGNPGGSSQPIGSPQASNGGGGAGGPGYIETISSFYTDYRNNNSGVGGDGLAAFGGDPGIPPSFGTSAPPTYRSGRYFAGGGGGVSLNPVPGTPGVYAYGRGQPNCGGGGGFTGTGYILSPTPWPFPQASAQLYTGGGGSGYFDVNYTFNGQAVHGAPGIVIFRYKISNSTI